MNPNAYDDGPRNLVLDGKAGRDAGKRFRINEVDPVTMAGFVLRLLAALRLSQTDDLLGLFQAAALPEDAEDADTQRDLDAIKSREDLTSILRLLTGCDPVAVHALISDALQHVEVAPDPQHPGAFRKLMVADIREMATLGDVLGGFARLNLLPG